MMKNFLSQFLILSILLQTTLSGFAPNVRAALTTLDRSQLTAQGNVLTNGGFEASTAAWTASGGTLTTVTSSVGSGLAAGSWDSSASGQTLSTAYQTVSAGDGFSGQPGVVSCRFKCPSGGCTHTLSAFNGTSDITTAQTISSNTSQYVRKSVPFTYPISGTVRLQIKSVASNEPAVQPDDCYMGLAENLSGFNSFTGVYSLSPQKAGFIQPTAATTCPSGWLAADGSAVSRNTYSQYYANVGTTYGVGDGSTTVNLPNAQGVFLRGAGSQTISGSSYTGTQGTSQTDLFKSHNHGGSVSGGSHSHQYTVRDATGTGQKGLASGNASWPNPNIRDLAEFDSGSHSHTIASDGGTETRPANISVKYCVKMYDDVSAEFYRPDLTNWKVDTTISGASPDLNTGSNVTTYSPIESGSFTLTNNSSAAGFGVTLLTAKIGCSSTNSSTGTTCAAGNESNSVVFTPPTSGWVKACTTLPVDYDVATTGSATGSAVASYRIVKTGTANQTADLTVGGGLHIQTGGFNAVTAQARMASHVPHNWCEYIYLQGGVEAALRTQYTLTVGGTVNGVIVNAQGPAVGGTGVIHWTVEPVTQPAPAILSTSSSSSSEKNYVTSNPTLEDGTTTGFSLGTATLTNGLPTGAPTFGSGASGNLSISASNSTPISGSYSLAYVSSAATTAGNFVSTDAFTMDPEGQAKRLYFSVSYRVNSGTVNMSGTSSNSFGVALYDVTNSAWITDCDGQFNIVQSSGVGLATGSCQTSATGTSYRMVWYNANATSGAVNLSLDNFKYAPTPGLSTAVVNTPAVAAFNSWLPADLAGTFASPTQATVSTLGNSGITFTTNGTATTITSSTSLTAGTMQLNFSKVGWYQIMVTGRASYSNATSFAELPIAYGGTATRYAASSTFYPFVLAVGTGDASGTDTFFLQATAPGQTLTLAPQYRVTGGGSTSQRIAVAQVQARQITAPDGNAEGRVVSSRATSSTTTIATTATNVVYPTVSGDTHAAYNASTGTYTFSVSGWYKAVASIFFNPFNWSAGDEVDLQIKQNGSTIVGRRLFYPPSLTSKQLQVMASTGQFFANAGDTLQVSASNSVGSRALDGNGSLNYFTVERTSGSATPQGSETVFASMSGGAANASSDQPIIFVTATKDTHNAYNSSTGKYRIPVSGTYRATFMFYGGASANVLFYATKNATPIVPYMGIMVGSTGVGSGSSTFSASTGDLIDVRVASATSSITNPAGWTIEKVGN